MNGIFVKLQESEKGSNGDYHFLTSFSVLILAIAFNSLVIAQPPETHQKAKNIRVSPEQLSASFAEVAKKVEPAVVNIDTKGRIPNRNYRGSGSGEIPKDVEEYMRNLPRASYAVGSGFIVDKSGYILTNFHVIENSTKITVRLQNRDEYIAKVVGADRQTDLAVLKIEAKKDLPFLKLGNSEAIRIGDWVLAIGSPFGLARTVTAGIISQTNRENPDRNPFQRFIQTDAAINRGNSGGPLVNMVGEVIGVNSQIATSTGDYNGIGFALPSNQVNYVYRQIVQNGKVKRGYLGVYLDSVGKEFAAVYGMKEAKGAIITSVLDPSASAGKAGLIADDIIIEIDGKRVQNHQDLINKIASIPPGNDVRIKYLREIGTKIVEKNVTVKLDERPGNNAVVSDDGSRRKLPIDGKKASSLPFGLTLIELNPQNAASFNYKGERGVLISKIDRESFINDVKNTFGKVALNRNDLIKRINRVEVISLEQFNGIVAKMKKGDPVVLHLSSYERRSRTSIPTIVQFTVQ